MDCREILFLLQMQPEELAAPRREALEGHLAACPACQGYRRRLQGIRRHLREGAAEFATPFHGLQRPSLPLPSRRIPWPWIAAAAAAGLALYCRVTWLGPGEGPQASPQATPATRAPISSPIVFQGLCKAESGDRDGVVGRSVLASIRQGGTLRVEGSRLELVSGALHLDSPGEAVSVQAASGLLALEDGEVSLELLRKPGTLSWLASAYADQAEEAPWIRLVVWRGQASLVLGGEKTSLQAGQGVLMEGGRLTLDKSLRSAAWRGLTGWVDLVHEPLVLKDSARDFLSVPHQDGKKGYVLEVLLRKRVPIAELSLRLSSEAGTFEFPVGAYLTASEQWTRIRLECQGGWCRASVGSSEIVSCAGTALERMGLRMEAGGVGLRAWGGDVEVKEVRWRLVK